MALRRKSLARLRDPVVIGALGVIAFLYSVTVFNVIIPWYAITTSGMGHVLVLSSTTAMGAASYLCMALTDPGRVPPNWIAPDQPGPAQVKRNGAPRYCNKCGAHKPHRAHHCRRCGRCVLRMDHHCAFAGTCVGEGNVRAFLCCCGYLAAASLHSLALLLALDGALAWEALFEAAGEGEGAGDSATVGPWLASSREIPWGLRAAAQVAATALALPATIGLLTLAAWHAWLALRNLTTIEFKEGVRVAGAGVLRESPWAGHGMDNLEAVCGLDVYKWPWPWPPGMAKESSGLEAKGGEAV